MTPPDFIAIVLKRKAIEERRPTPQQVMLHTNAFFTRFRYNTSFNMVLGQMMVALVMTRLGDTVGEVLFGALFYGIMSTAFDGLVWLVRRKHFIE